MLIMCATANWVKHNIIHSLHDDKQDLVMNAFDAKLFFCNKCSVKNCEIWYTAIQLTCKVDRPLMAQRPLHCAGIVLPGFID